MEKIIIDNVKNEDRISSRLWTGAVPMKRAFKSRIKNLQFLPVSLFGSVMGIAGL